MSKVYCVGGFLSGKTVDCIGSEYLPMSKDDLRDYYSLTAKELMNTEKPKDKYQLYKAEMIYFYVWNDEDSLKDNILNKYIGDKI